MVFKIEKFFILSVQYFGLRYLIGLEYLSLVFSLRVELKPNDKYPSPIQITSLISGRTSQT